MSEELQDEVEAINSIYGEGTLCPASGEDPSNSPSSTTTTLSYILKLPGDASSLQLKFPADYPGQPPEVLGTHHSSGGKKGAGARDLGLFRESLSSVFQAGAVCLFDAVEEFNRRYEEEVVSREAAEALQHELDAEVEAEAAEEERQVATSAAAAATTQDVVGVGGGGGVNLSSLPAPPWTQSEVISDMKSIFIAHVAPVRSPDQARLYVAQLLASDKKIRSATHNMTAWRIRGDGKASYQDCDDDGEAAAGGRLLHLMQLMDVWDAMVVVTRWYGGVHMGPRRFAVINAAARDGFVRAGMVVEKEKEGKKKGK